MAEYPPNEDGGIDWDSESPDGARCCSCGTDYRVEFYPGLVDFYCHRCYEIAMQEQDDLQELDFD